MSSVETFDFSAVEGQRWRVTGTGYKTPEHEATCDIEWEDGTEATFGSYRTDLRFWADDWMESHDSDEWSSEPLPSMFQREEWTRGVED